MRARRPDLIAESQRWLDLLATPQLNEYQKRRLVQDTLDNFDDYFNRGYIDYRKSVGELDGSASIEWTGKGSYLEDVQGRRYLDCQGGFGIYSCGIRHPKIISAVRSQLERMPMSSQELLDPLRGALAHLLGEIAPGDLQKCFFISNGTDAVEGAMKLARFYTGRSGFISCLGAFHGKSYGSLSLMGMAEFRVPFEPLLQDVYFVPFGDAKAVENELKKAEQVGFDVAAVVAEPVQGEAGAVVPPDDFWPRLKEICKHYGVLLIADEVQTGLGRTGALWGVDHWEVAPDIMCVGEAIGGGVMPLSAFISTPEIWKVLEKNPGIHSTTFGGNPLACAAGIAAINVVLEEDLPAKAAASGAYLLEKLRKMREQYPDVCLDVRGKGLMLGMEFVDPEFNYAVSSGMFKRGVLVSGMLINERTMRIEPALDITREQCDEFLQKLEETVRSLSRSCSLTP
ncbi:MAG: aminotransferase class III-fold pyridoxal phosphate-dependent enzyme [Acidobacteriota bacterium]